MVVLKKQEIETNVYQSALDRFRYLFDSFDKVVVSFSGGKDSTVIFNLCKIVAKEKNKLPMKVMFLDQEAEWDSVIEHIREIMTDPDVEPMWIQAPILLKNGWRMPRREGLATLGKKKKGAGTPGRRRRGPRAPPRTRRQRARKRSKQRRTVRRLPRQTLTSGTRLKRSFTLRRGTSNPRNPLHFDGIEGGRNARNPLRTTQNTLNTLRTT